MAGGVEQLLVAEDAAAAVGGHDGHDRSSKIHHLATFFATWVDKTSLHKIHRNVKNSL